LTSTAGRRATWPRNSSSGGAATAERRRFRTLQWALASVACAGERDEEETSMNDITQPDSPSSGILVGGRAGGMVLRIERNQTSIELKAIYNYDPKDPDNTSLPAPVTYVSTGKVDEENRLMFEFRSSEALPESPA
jgi:hypothetical protein